MTSIARKTSPPRLASGACRRSCSSRGEKVGDAIEGADLKGIEARLLELGAVERAIPDPDEPVQETATPEEKKDN